MAGSNSPSIRELALAALARQRGGGETARETAVRQGVSPLHPASHPREIPISGVDQPLSFGVSPSHAMEMKKVRHRENCETPRETLVRQFGGSTFAEALELLERQCPDHVEAERWRQCVADAQRFLANWSDNAAALGWTAEELFGLHPVPARPAPSYCRLSRYDSTGLLWLLRGRPVLALTNTTAAIETPSGTVVYRKLGDGLDDFNGGDPPEVA